LGVLAILTGCPLPGTADDGDDEPPTDTATEADTDTDTDTPDGPLPLSPEVCQADLRVLRTEDNRILQYPVVYKDSFWGARDVVTQDGTTLGIVKRGTLPDQETNTTILTSFSPFPGGTATQTWSPGVEHAVALDLGVENAPVYPLVFPVSVTQDGCCAPDRRAFAFSPAQGPPVIGFYADAVVLGEPEIDGDWRPGEAEVMTNGTLIAELR
jgi:hypothetical protein